MRKLDICVPHWQETPEEMEPLLDSIKVQRAVDLSQVGVVIAYDGPDASELPLDEWRSRYPFAIEDVHPEKGGVSHTRNAALDASEAEFVMFADADDCLMDNRGLFIVFREMDADPNPQELAVMGVSEKDAGKGFDFLVCDFVEENKRPDTGKMDYLPHVNNMTFVHSQVARRQWLVDNGIRFNDALTVHEDSYFVCLCRELVKPYRGKYCAHPWFLWCWRDASVCRHDPDYILKTYNNMLDSNDALVDEFTRRMMPEKANSYCVMMVFDAYYCMNKPEWIEVNHKDYRDRVERRFAEYFRKHESKWDAVSPQERAVISNGVRQRSVGEGMLMEAITIDDWLKRIKSL